MSTEPAKVTVAVCGGIAAYKSVELVRLLQDAGLDPHVVMTRAAQEFIQPLTFAAISGHKVITSLWDTSASTVEPENQESAIEHIHEAQTTRALIVAPATADILARFAHGHADDFLTTMYLATKAPVIVAPAMNVNMWDHPATQANLQTIRDRGVIIVAPASGYLACGMVGGGRLADPTTILQTVTETLANKNQQDLTHETVVVTAGGTREPIDPVRFIGNRSSGKMGYAIAEAARARGARVILISAPTSLPTPTGCELVPVTTADQMRAAVLQHLDDATVLIMSAAVSDYRVANAATTKIKREGPLTLALEPTEDILHEAAQRRHAGSLIIGFAAETDNILDNARAKLRRKGVDAIVVNDISSATTGFDSDWNAGTFLTIEAEIDLPLSTKSAMAHRILDQAQVLRNTANLPAKAAHE
jgi:phosphopantothenoylcysteine decarboxylase / phosphopantothenate---cysteine ligase